MQPLLICDEAEDLMPLNETDKSWIRETIRDAHKSHGLGRLTRFIKEWSGAGAAVGIIVFVLTQWTAYTEFRVQTTGRLTAIEGQLAKQSVVTHASLPLSEFKTTLPELSAAVATVRQQKLSVSPQVVVGLQQKLTATDTSAPGFWPVSAELISFRSFNNGSEQTKGLLSAKLPDCVDSEPHSAVVTKVIEPNIIQYNVPYYENCRFTLDSPHDDERINEVLMTKAFSALEFRHCLIIYNGGNVNILFLMPDATGTRIVDPLGKFNGHTTAEISGGPELTFTNCLFAFSISKTPPPGGQKMTETLLAQNAEKMSIPRPIP
jgi:hypothetical protein